MAYTTSQILQWAKISQPLSAIGEGEQKAFTQGNTVNDLHLKLYVERTTLQFQYDNDPSDSQGYLYGMSQYVLALIGGEYLFAAQDATGGGSSTTPTVPTSTPIPIEFVVTGVSYIIDGQSSKIITSFVGFNLIFIRNNITQSTVDTGTSYYSWDSTNGLFTCYGAATATELFQLYAV